MCLTGILAELWPQLGELFQHLRSSVFLGGGDFSQRKDLKREDWLVLNVSRISEDILNFFFVYQHENENIWNGGMGPFIQWETKKFSKYSFCYLFIYYHFLPNVTYPQTPSWSKE